MKTPRKCQSFKAGQSGVRRCARFIPDSGPEVGSEPDTAMHKGGFAAFPGLDMTVNTGDLLSGAAVGLLAGSGARWLANRFAATWLPAGVMRFVPVLGGAAAAAGLYYYSASVGKKARGMSHAAGAFGASVVVNIWDMLRAKFPQLADLSAYSGYGYLTAGISPNSGSPAAQSYGALTPDTSTTGYQGIVIDTGNPRMNELALSAMGSDDSDDYTDYGY